MSTLRTNKIENTSGIEVYTAKAWVNFNGTGTVAIRAAGNVSSITDNGVGDYTVNFTTSMTDASYSVCTAGKLADTTSLSGTNYSVFHPNAYTSSSIRLACGSATGIAQDTVFVNLAVFR